MPASRAAISMTLDDDHVEQTTTRLDERRPVRFDEFRGAPFTTRRLATPKSAARSRRWSTSSRRRCRAIVLSSVVVLSRVAIIRTARVLAACRRRCRRTSQDVEWKTAHQTTRCSTRLVVNAQPTRSTVGHKPPSHRKKNNSSSGYFHTTRPSSVAVDS